MKKVIVLCLMLFFTTLLFARNEKLLENGKTLYHKGKLYKVLTSPYTGKKWLDRNLGAIRTCTSLQDKKCYGDYFQWGRMSDGHEKKDSAITSILSYNDYPNHSKFIKVRYSTNYEYDWRAGQNNKLWQSSKGKSNPCPNGFRIPTINELKKETLDQGVKNGRTAYQNFLKFPFAGYRHYSSGSYSLINSNAYIWSKSLNGKRAKHFSFGNSYAKNDDSKRSEGLSIRCLKN
jgi:hypothetical protein